MKNPLFDEIPVTGKKYNYGDWKLYAIHDNENVMGFFGDYRWASNFHIDTVYFYKFDFVSTEHAYHFAKQYRIGHNLESIKNYLNTLSLAEVKKWGNSIKIDPDWEKIKYDIMAALVFDKFYRHHDLREKLLATGDKFLEETNHWHDNIWGNCVCAKCKKTNGKNWLGRILMKTREFWR